MCQAFFLVTVMPTFVGTYVFGQGVDVDQFSSCVVCHSWKLKWLKMIFMPCLVSFSAILFPSFHSLLFLICKKVQLYAKQGKFIENCLSLYLVYLYVFIFYKYKSVIFQFTFVSNAYSCLLLGSVDQSTIVPDMIIGIPTWWIIENNF